MSEAKLLGYRIPDRIEIEQVMYEYARAADHADVDAQLATLTNDCRVSYSGGRWYEGKEELREALESAFARYVQTSHAVTNIEITFTGTDTATAESVITAWHRDHAGNEWTLHGRYLDEWFKGRDGWHISVRRIRAAGAVGRDESSLDMLQRMILSDGH
jgi:uncharacterized protein (TIGR02246 family)